MEINATEFKAKYLKLVDEIAQSREPLVITKCGKHVTKVAPIKESHPTSPFGYVAGTLEITGDIISPIDQRMEKALALPGLQCLPLEPALSFDAHHLPGKFHHDPIDRLLVATARHHSHPLITENRKILDYAQQGYVRARSSCDKELLKP